LNAFHALLMSMARHVQTTDPLSGKAKVMGSEFIAVLCTRVSDAVVSFERWLI
jgi:hypothetical protein